MGWFYRSIYEHLPVPSVVPDLQTSHRHRGCVRPAGPFFGRATNRTLIRCCDLGIGCGVLLVMLAGEPGQKNPNEWRMPLMPLKIWRRLEESMNTCGSHEVKHNLSGGVLK